MKFEKNDNEGFLKFMARGKALIEYAAEDNLDGFQKIFAESVKQEEIKNMMYWHVTRAFKIALRHKSLLVIEHLIEDLDLDLTHQSFKETFHMFLFVCQMAENVNDEDMKEVNRQVVRYLAKASQKNMDQTDSNGSTVLQLACESLSDIIIIETIVNGGAQLNCVNNDN